jgi:hypothetical protein
MKKVISVPNSIKVDIKCSKSSPIAAKQFPHTSTMPINVRGKERVTSGLLEYRLTMRVKRRLKCFIHNGTKRVRD